MYIIISYFHYGITLGSLAKYSIRTDGTSAKSVLQRVPVICWYSVLANIECIAWPISWNKLSTIEGVSKVGPDQRGKFKFNIITTTGF